MKADKAREPQALTKDELNLAEYPFTLLSERAPRGAKTIQFADTVVRPNGAQVERRWTVTGSDAYGLPTSSDEPVYLALMQLAREQGFQSLRVHFTFYDLAKRLGLPINGRTFARLRASLLRLAGVQIVADRAFYRVQKADYSTLSFGIIDGFLLEGAKGSRAKSYADFNVHLWHAIEAGSLKTLDFAVYLSLKSSVSRRLYRFLDKAKYDGKKTYSIGLQKLAFERLGMPRHYAPSKIKRFLSAAHEELQAVGFVSKAEYVQGKDAELVRYTFAQVSQETLGLIRELTSRGIGIAAARSLVKRFDAVRIRRNLKAFDALNHRLVKNPAGWLRAAIEADYALVGSPAPEPLRADVPEASATPGVSDAEFERLLAQADPRRVAELESRITEEVANSPLYRGRPLGKGAKMLIRQRLSALLATDGQSGF